VARRTKAWCGSFRHRGVVDSGCGRTAVGRETRGGGQRREKCFPLSSALAYGISPSAGHRSAVQKTMNKTLILLSIVFLTGCAAPPPVKIASKLLGRTVFQQVKDEVSDPDDDTPTPPTTGQE